MTRYGPTPDDYSPETHGILPISVINFASKNVLNQAAENSDMFKSAWEELSDKTENAYWFCVSDPLNEDWVRENESGDSELFMSLTEIEF